MSHPISLHQYAIFVGLGNPGKKYAMTRHNLGFMVVEAFAKRQGWHFKDENRLLASVTGGKVGETLVMLIKPLTYMNESGVSLRRVLNYYELNEQHVAIVSDDKAIEFGSLRLREKGSPGGHNGLKSIEAELGTRHYIRLRMGIGSPEEKKIADEDTLKDFVLSPFDKVEREKLEAFIERGADVLFKLLKAKLSDVMNEVNVKIIPQNLKEEQVKKE